MGSRSWLSATMSNGPQGTSKPVSPADGGLARRSFRFRSASSLRRHRRLCRLRGAVVRIPAVRLASLQHRDPGPPLTPSSLVAEIAAHLWGNRRRTSPFSRGRFSVSGNQRSLFGPVRIVACPRCRRARAPADHLPGGPPRPPEWPETRVRRPRRFLFPTAATPPLARPVEIDPETGVRRTVRPMAGGRMTVGQSDHYPLIHRCQHPWRASRRRGRRQALADTVSRTAPAPALCRPRSWTKRDARARSSSFLVTEISEVPRLQSSSLEYGLAGGARRRHWRS